MKKLLLLLAIAVAAAFLYQQTNALRTTQVAWQSGRVPPGFEGFRIVQVSDLHNKRFGKNQKRLLQAIRKANPDIIALTGDIINRGKDKTLEPTREFLEGAAAIAPLYYVDGNHDPNSSSYQAFRSMLSQYDVTVLDRNADVIERGGATMRIAGYAYWSNKFDNAALAASDIILCHNPDMFPYFAESGCGVLLAGHIHGGQIALPGGRAVLSPGGGFFPRYSSGVYHEDGATMVLSCGLGTSWIPIRLFAPPEIVIVELKPE